MSEEPIENYNAVVSIKDNPALISAYKFATKKLDYSKMYYTFNFTDGKQAKFRMDKDCHTMQDFLDRMNKVHELEQQKQQAIALIKDGRFVEALQLLEGRK